MNLLSDLFGQKIFTNTSSRLLCYLSNVAQSMGDGKHITECHLAKTIADCIII